MYCILDRFTCKVKYVVHILMVSLNTGMLQYRYVVQSSWINKPTLGLSLRRNDDGLSYCTKCRELTLNVQYCTKLYSTVKT